MSNKPKNNENVEVNSGSIQAVVTRLFGYIEQLSEEVHNAWWKEKKKQNFHSPNECRSLERISFNKADSQSKQRFEDAGYDPKFYKWCGKCHTDMYPYSELPENVKEYDRVTVKSVLEAIKKIV